MTSDSDVDALCLDKSKVTLQSEAQDDKYGLNGNAKSEGWTPLLILAAFTCCFGSALPAGYNIGVMNNVDFVIKNFLNDSIAKRYSVNISYNQLLYCWASIISICLIGGMAGSLVSGYLADRYGRKGALIIGNIFGILGGVCLFIIKPINAVELFWIGRILVGVSGGLATSLVPMYMTEVAPINLRGAVGVICQLGLTLGVFASQILSLQNVFGNEESWNFLMLAFVPICLIAALLTLKLPESPKYLYIVKGDQASASRDLCRLRKKELSLLQNEINLLEQEAMASAINESWTILKVLKSRELQLPLILVCLLQGGQQMSGINSVFYYSSSIFQSAGLSSKGAQYTTLGTGIANILMAVISAKLLCHIGRRKLFLSSCYSSIVCLVVLCISIPLSENEIMKWTAIIALISFVFTYGLGLGPIPYFIGSELFDVGPKSAAMSLGSMCNWGANFLVGMFFTVVRNYIGSYTFLIFVACMTFVALFVSKYMPETLGKTTTEVSKMMASGFRQKYHV